MVMMMKKHEKWEGEKTGGFDYCNVCVCVCNSKGSESII